MRHAARKRGDAMDVAGDRTIGDLGESASALSSASILLQIKVETKAYPSGVPRILTQSDVGRKSRSYD